MNNLKEYLAPVGRLLMSSLFIWSGYGKVTKLEVKRLLQEAGE